MIFRPDSGQFYLVSQILMPEIRRRSKPLLPIRIASGRFLDAIGELAHGYLANHLQMQFYLNLKSEVFWGYFAFTWWQEDLHMWILVALLRDKGHISFD